jgi:hypothetical protein
MPNGGNQFSSQASLKSKRASSRQSVTGAQSTKNSNAMGSLYHQGGSIANGQASIILKKPGTAAGLAGVMDPNSIM